jgi:outer membrane protein
MKAPLVIAALCAATFTAQAQDGGLPLWEVGVLGGTVSTPAYPASADRAVRSLVLAFFI